MIGFGYYGYKYAVYIARYGTSFRDNLDFEIRLDALYEDVVLEAAAVIDETRELE